MTFDRARCGRTQRHKSSLPGALRRFFAPGRSKQMQLWPGPGRLEARAVERLAVVIQSEPLAGERESMRGQGGEVAGTALPRGEGRVVILAAAHLAHEAHDVIRLQRIVRREPILEQRRDLVRQTQQYVPGRRRARLARALEN